jgi:DNA-binding GntR family transcriptional regulator
LGAAEDVKLQFERLETTSLRARARVAIRANISTGALEAGELYSVGSIAEVLGVSATPVREALLDLASQGLVELVRNRGFRVPILTERELDDIFELRLLIEVPPLTKIAGHLDPVTAAECRELAAENEAAAKKGDILGFLDSDRRFHVRLLEAIGNRRLVDMTVRLRDMTRLSGLGALSGSPELVRSAREHRQLIDALSSGSQTATRSLITRHLKHTRGMWAGRVESSSSAATDGHAPELVRDLPDAP